MKKWGLLLAMMLIMSLPLAAAYMQGDLLWRGNFADLQLPRAENGNTVKLMRNAAPGGLDAVQFSCKEYATLVIRIPLDVKKINGLIRFEAWVKSEKTQTPPGKQYWGTKLQLVVKKGDKTDYPEPPIRNETSVWKKISADCFVDPKTEHLNVRIGMENCKGVYSVADFRIYRLNHVPDSEIKMDRTAHWAEAEKLPRGDGGHTRYRGFMSGNDLSPAAIRVLKQWNANILRYQMNAGERDISTREKYLDWIDSEMRKIDELLPLLGPDFKVVIDLHSAPCRKPGKPNLIGVGWNQNLLLETWRKIARHYRGNPQIYGFDILNEPEAEDYVADPSKSPWISIAQQAVDAIREINPDTPIIIAWHGLHGRHPFQLKGEHLIYSPHFYSPINYTHQGVLNQLNVSYPGIVDNIYFDKERLRLSMGEIIRFSREHKLKIFIGEFSTINNADGAEKWLADSISLFEEYGWDWCYHAFREWPPWSIEHENRYQPSADNPRKKVILDALKQNLKTPGKP